MSEPEPTYADGIEAAAELAALYDTGKRRPSEAVMTPRDPLARPDRESPNVLADGAWIVRDGVLVWEPADGEGTP